MNILLAFLIVGQSVPESGYGLEVKPVVDYDNGLVYYEQWVDSLYLGTADVERFDDYLIAFGRDMALEDFKKRLRERSLEETGGVEGIIPDLKLDVAGERTDIMVDGQDKITLGSQISYPDSLPPGTPKPNIFDGIQPLQDLNVSVKGIIARKTEVTLNYTAGGTTGLFDESDNKVNIKYTGDEDEIVKFLQAGDIALDFGHTRQQLAARQGLFGINGKVQLGPVDVYAVMAREQTTLSSKRVTGNSQLQEGVLEDRDFLEKKFFQVFHSGLRDSLYKVDFGTEFPRFHLYQYSPVDRDYPDSLKKWYGDALPYPADSTQQSEDIEFDKRFWELSRDKDYKLLHDSKSGWVIQLTGTYLGSDNILAVACTTSSGASFGAYDSIRDSVSLLLVWGSNPDSANITWTNMLRNRYSLGGIKDASSVEITVYKMKGSEPQKLNEEGIAYSYLLGLTDDSESNKHKFTSDEVSAGYTLIFPDIYPFAAADLGLNTSDSTKIHRLYWSTNPDDANAGGVFKIEYKYESILTSYNVGAFVKRGSVKVFLNGKELEEGKDYSVNYDIGEITFIRTIAPTDEIEILAEQKEFLALDRKSLLGLRAEGEILEGVNLGTSILFRSVGYSMESRPTLGMEPYSNTVGELDLSTERKLPFLTKWMDWLPLVSTEAASQANLAFNSSISMPDLNTHRSGAVWIEDFEGTKEEASIPLSESELGNWYITSLPLDENDQVLDTARFSRVRPKWITRLTGNYKKEIFGEDVQTGGATGQSYDMQIPKITWTPGQNEDSTYWTGIIGGNGNRKINISSAENMEFIIRTKATRGRIHFDFGSSINEDQLRRNVDGEFVGLGVFNEEDKNDNGTLDLGEDVGLDGVAGVDSPRVSGDDGNDDKDETKNPNGTEGNNRLDSEDLLNRGFFRDNDYYEFTLDLSDESFFSQYVDSLKGDSAWIMISIPLRDSTFYRIYGSPRNDEIGLFRIWFEGTSQPVDLEIYSWQFAGNKWQEPMILSFDSTANPVDTMLEKVYIDVIGTETKDYTSPINLGETSTGEPEQDHSLLMRYENIASGHKGKATRWDYQPTDIRAYHRLRIYVHNDANDPTFYLRVGSDERNYYEMRKQISAGTIPSASEDPLWRECVFELDSLVALKVRNDSILGDTSQPVIASPDSTLFIQGFPSFSSVRYFELGVINDVSNGAISGGLWFNDIRLEDVDSYIGTNLSLSGGLQLADVGRASVNYSSSKGSFSNLLSAPGPRIVGESSNLNLSGDLDLHKFGLEKLGFSVPVRAGWVRSRSLPRYSPDITDFVMAEADALDAEEQSTSQNLNFSLSHSKSKSKLLKYTLDGIKGSANYKWVDSRTRAGLEIDASATQNYALSYDASPDLSFNLGKEKISYFPRSIRLSTNFDIIDNKNWFRQDLSDTFSTSPTGKDFNASLGWSASSSFDPVRFLPLSVTYNVQRSLPAETDTMNTISALDSLVSFPFFKRDLSLNASLSSINFKSFGRPSVSVRTSFVEDHSYSLYEQLREYKKNDEGNVPPDTERIIRNARNLSNFSSLNMSWATFDINGLLLAAKRKIEKQVSELRDELRQEADSLKEQTVLPDSLSSDTVVADLLLPDTIPADSLKDSVPQIPRSPELVLLENRLQVLEVLGKATKVFVPITLEGLLSRQTSYNWYVDPSFSWRNEWMYVMGISDSLNEDSSASRGITPFNKSWTYSVKANSGLNLFGFNVRGNIAYALTRIIPPVLGDSSFKSSWTLPSVTVSYDKLEELLTKIKVITTTQLNSGFTHQMSKDWYRDTEVDNNGTLSYPLVVRSTSHQYTFSPLLSWSATWKGKINTSLSANYSITHGLNNPGTASEVEIKTTTKGITGSLGYTFNKPSGFKIPILKHIKFKNDLTLNLTGNYNEIITNNSAADPQEERTQNYTATLGGLYTFSDAFDGGFNFKLFRTQSDQRPTYNRTDVEFNIWILFKF